MSEPSRDEVDQLDGPTVIEFGTGWCPHCIAARPVFDQVVSEYPEVRHLQIEDGRGKPLGRSFRVKLWPTFVFLVSGTEVARVVRPRDTRELREAMARLVAASASATGRPAAG